MSLSEDAELEIIRLKKIKLDRLIAEQEEKKNLPHLHSHKFYPWMREFFDDYEHKIMCVTAANQIGKSSILIRKMIELATNKDLWALYWPELPEHNPVPSQFWYCYPSRDVATIEWFEKWSEYMPRNQDCPVRGWKANMENGKIHSVDFKSGVTIYFKTYAQDVHMLQSGTVYMLGGDEEMPVELFPELSMRVNSTNGYLYFVFTATRGQEFWRHVVETRQKLPEARVWQVSLYDCQFYEDGTITKWTASRIQQAIDRCANKVEIDRRIMGRFIPDTDRKYPSFDRDAHMIDPFAIPSDWTRVVGIDVGSGGETGHPSAISFIAINPEHSFAVVYKFWRGDNVTTTAQDVVNKYQAMAVGEPSHVVYYDWASADLKNIAAGQGLPFVKAEKNHLIGENILNSMFSFNMLKIFKTDESEKLCIEFENLLNTTDKKKAIDDGVDSVRYAAAKVSWNFVDVSFLSKNAGKKEPVILTDEQREIKTRRDAVLGLADHEKDPFNVDSELNYWNDMY